MFTVQLVGGPHDGHVEDRTDAPAELHTIAWQDPPEVRVWTDPPVTLMPRKIIAVYRRHWRHEDGTVVYRYVTPVRHDEGAGL